MIVSITRRLHFSAGHRVMGHEGHCNNIHGHNYFVFIEATASDLDDLGRVIDFSVLKRKVGGWIDENWDHKFIANTDDNLVRSLSTGLQQFPVYFLPDNPTAENMALYLLDVVCPMVLADTGVRVTRVYVEETANCYATATNDSIRV